MINLFIEPVIRFAIKKSGLSGAAAITHLLKAIGGKWGMIGGVIIIAGVNAVASQVVTTGIEATSNGLSKLIHNTNNKESE